MSTTTSPGPGCGSGTCSHPSTSTPPWPRIVTAHMAANLTGAGRRTSLAPSFVTEHNATVASQQPRSSDGVPDLYRRVERQVPRLARRMIDTFVAEIPLYAMLPREQLDGEILDITSANLRLFFAALADGRALEPDELADIRTSAARRAEERVPLDAVLSAYHVGGRIGWGAVGGDASGGGTPPPLTARGRGRRNGCGSTRC